MLTLQRFLLASTVFLARMPDTRLLGSPRLAFLKNSFESAELRR